MNDFDNQPDASAEFEADTLDNYSADEAAASSLALEMSDEESEARARVMRANLDQFDLDEEDLPRSRKQAMLPRVCPFSLSSVARTSESPRSSTVFWGGARPLCRIRPA